MAVSAAHEADARPLTERLAVAAQHLLPRQALTRFAGMPSRGRGWAR